MNRKRKPKNANLSGLVIVNVRLIAVNKKRVGFVGFRD